MAKNRKEEESEGFRKILSSHPNPDIIYRFGVHHLFFLSSFKKKLFVSRNNLSYHLNIAIAFFRKFWKEKAVTLLLDSDNLVFNGRNIGRLDSIESLVVEEYISAEAITGIRTIKLKMDHDTIAIVSGVNEVDYKEMVSILLTFLKIPNSKLLEKIR